MSIDWFGWIVSGVLEARLIWDPSSAWTSTVIDFGGERAPGPAFVTFTSNLCPAWHVPATTEATRSAGPAAGVVVAEWRQPLPGGQGLEHTAEAVEEVQGQQHKTGRRCGHASGSQLRDEERKRVARQSDRNEKSRLLEYRSYGDGLVSVRQAGEESRSCGGGGDREPDREGTRPRRDQRPPRDSSGECGLDDSALLVASRETRRAGERPDRKQDGQRMKTSELDITADRVGSNRRGEQGDELGAEGDDRAAECSALGRGVAGDLVEGNGLYERRERRGKREAHDPPATQTQTQKERGHEVSALGFRSLK